MQHIVINTDHNNPYHLPKAIVEYWLKLSGIKHLGVDENGNYYLVDEDKPFDPDVDIPRYDSILVKAVQQYPELVGGLKVISIPDDVEWYIASIYEGSEAILEKYFYRVWY